MQRLSNEELQEFKNEFEITCAAQDGNRKAWMTLWSHYRSMLMSRLIAVKGYSREELESEACEIFALELDHFDRKKISSESAYSMHSWLWCRVLNKTNKLIKKRKKDVHLYFEDVNANMERDGVLEYVSSNFSTDEDISPVCNQMFGSNTGIYNAYNPEKLAMENLKDSDSKRIKAFYSNLSSFDRDILEFRRRRLTLIQVAERMHCSVTTVKNRINKAKRLASDIFMVCYT